MKVVIINYEAGNIQSVMFALQRLNMQAELSNDPETIRQADKVILPGVGQAGTAMQSLQKNGLDELIPTLKQPFLGICLGLQLLCKHSEEGDTNGLGIFPVAVKKFQNPPGKKFKIPHMGWNSIEKLKWELSKGVEEKSYVYFVHSYFAEASEFTTATTNYIQPFSSALQRDNFYAVQFHPEKSGTVGEQILRNFIERT